MDNLILALDGLDWVESKAILAQFWSLEDVKWKIIFKLNDVLELKWMEWFINSMKSLEHYNWADLRFMVDLKRHDIPDTISRYFKRLSESWLWSWTEFVTIMATWWPDMMKKAVDTRNQLWLKTKILAVTVLTSISDEQSLSIYGVPAKYWVLKLTNMALESGVDGIVCSPNEAQMLRSVFGAWFDIVTPWRFVDSKKDAQTRISTPDSAIRNGATSLVVGRPILKAANPQQALLELFSMVNWVEYVKSWEYTFEKLLIRWSWEDLLKHIGAVYERPQWWKYVRLASKLLSDWYVNIWSAERSYLILDRAASELANSLREKWVNFDIVMWAQMWSVRLSSYLERYTQAKESIYTEKNWDNMALKRHDIPLLWKKVVLSEDVITKWSTIIKMKKLIEDNWGEVVAITCIVNRYWSDKFEWIPLISTYTPRPYNFYYDENTPTQEIETKKAQPLPDWALISEKPKFDWAELKASMQL